MFRKGFRAKSQGRYGKRHKPGEMNATEAAYAEILQARKLAGEVIEWWFEAVTFKLASDCRFTSDFAVFLADGTMEFVDAKGGGPENEKALVKARMAADKFYMFAFVIEKRTGRKGSYEWKRREF